MASRSEPADRRRATRLYLVTPALADPGALAADLAAMLGLADVAAVLLRLAEIDERTLLKRIKAIAPVVQDTGAALLLDGHVDLVAKSGADGAHVTGIDALKAAPGQLGPGRIVGAGGLRTRHDSMSAGEIADYVMFGEEAENRPPFEAILERVAWWAEVFQPSCVAFAASLDEVAPLVEAGTDFIAVGSVVFTADPATAIRAVTDRLVAAEPVQ